MSDYSPTFRVWSKVIPGGKEIDANFDELAYYLNNLKLGNLSSYANNAAAIGGGLVAGQLYRTGGDPDLVCVVH